MLSEVETSRRSRIQGNRISILYQTLGFPKVAGKLAELSEAKFRLKRIVAITFFKSNYFQLIRINYYQISILYRQTLILRL